VGGDTAPLVCMQGGGGDWVATWGDRVVTRPLVFGSETMGVVRWVVTRALASEWERVMVASGW
jgi:hypothetical protein